MKHRVGIYCRVSTHEQSVDPQLLALREYCQARGFLIFKEYIDSGVSGTKDSRPALNSLMDDARKQRINAVLVYRFDRFARSSRHLVQALEEFRSLGIDFVSYQENIDTSSPLGKAIFVIVGAMAELERNIIVERVKSGLASAKSKGKRLGRPSVSFDIEKLVVLSIAGCSIRNMASNLGVSRTVVHNYLSQSTPS